MQPHAPPAQTPTSRAWLAWGAGSGFFFFIFILRVSPSVMVDDLMRDFQAGAAVLGNLSGFYFYSYAVLQIPAGVIMDRFGPRHSLTLSAAVCGLGCALFATSNDIETAYLGRALIGAGAAFGWVGTLSIIANTFPHNRFASMAAGTQLLGMAGGIVGQAPLEMVVSQLGWRPTLGAFTLAMALGAVLLWLILQDRPSGRHSHGLLAGLQSALVNRQTWLNAATAITFAGPMLAFAGLWAVPFLTTTYGLHKSAAASLTSLFFVGWGLGGLMLGYLSDRSGRRRPFVVGGGTVMTLAVCAAIYLPDLSTWWIAILFVIAGAGGSSAVLTFARVRVHNASHAQGAAMGVVNTAMMASAVILQPLLGWLLDLNWDGTLLEGARVYSPEAFRTAFLVMPTATVLGITAAALARD